MTSLLIGYGICVLLNMLYIKRDKLPEDADAIVVLSGSSVSLTRQRLDMGLRLLRRYKVAQLVASGKDMAQEMENYLDSVGVKEYLIEDKSTNTYENAVFLKKTLSKTKKIILVTSSSHQRRAYHTFSRIVDTQIFNWPTNDLLTVYSPLTPLGWIANLANLFKDIRYNGVL